MVAIQPDNVRAAAAHLRVRAALAGDLDRDLRRAGLLSELDISGQLAACAEIDEELVILARILVSRADEAEGFFLPGNSWRLTSELLRSLLDERGAVAEMTAPIALHVLMEQGTSSAVDGSNPTTTSEAVDQLVFTIAGLEAVAADPQTSRELAAAAAFLASNPRLVEVTRAWEGTGALLPSHGVDEIPLRDIAAFLERNDVLRQLVGTDGVVSSDDLNTELDDGALLTAGIDPQRFDELAMPRTGHDLLVAAIHHDTFNLSPSVARDFIATLPVGYLDNQSIDIRSTDPIAIERLYAAATLDLGTSQHDFIIRAVLTAYLPEATTGIRNRLITSNYAELAAWHNAQLNGSTLAADPAYRGNNWFHLGTSASDSVSPVIEGEQRVFASAFFPGFGTPDAVDQDVADGNQAIYHHFMNAQASLWHSGSTGSQRLDTAFALLEEAAVIADPVEAQHLVAESTVLFSIEEQIVVDRYLQLDGLGIVDHGGALLITSADAFASTAMTVASNPLSLAINPLATLGLEERPRTAAQVMTDDGELRVQTDNGDLIPPLAIGDPVPRPTHGNNHIDPDLLAARLPDEFDWSQNQADNWAALDQRMPVIADVAILTLTEPALPAMVANQRRGNLAIPR